MDIKKELTDTIAKKSPVVGKGGFKSEGRGEFSQLPKMSAEKTYLGFRKCVCRFNQCSSSTNRF